MEVLSSVQKNYRPKFYGEGGKLFALMVVNVLLSIITLGIYYPWAKVKLHKYYYAHTELEGSRFVFHGKGLEYFLGFLKALLFVLIFVGPYLAGMILQNKTLLLGGLALYLIGFAIFIPLAIHGSLKYRTSRSSYRGIHFGYRGDKKELFKICIKGFLITLISFGLYSIWFVTDLRTYIVSKIRFGDVNFSFTGKGTDYFILHLKGYLLTIFTFGIYGFWYAKDIMNFKVNHTYAHQEQNSSQFSSSLQGFALLKFELVNIFLLVFSLGIALPWVMVRSFHFYFNHVSLNGAVDLDKVKQTEGEYKDATGEDMLDMLDIDLM